MGLSAGQRLGFLLSFSIALLKRLEKDLLLMEDIADVAEFFNKNMSGKLEVDVEELIAEALELGLPCEVSIPRGRP